MKLVRGHYSEAEFTAARPDCPHPERWTSSDWDSTEHQVTELVAAFVRALQPDLVVETGAAFGDTTAAIGDALVRNGHGRLITLETDVDRVLTVRERCASLPVEVVEMASLDWEPPGPIGFAWLDSLIDLRVPEFLRYRPWMESGTIVGFHDTGPHRPGIRVLLESLAGRGVIRLVMPRTPRGVCFAEVL